MTALVAAPGPLTGGAPSAVRDPVLDHRAVWLGLLGATPVATIAAAMALSPLRAQNVPLALSVNVLFVGLFAMGVTLLGEPGQRAPGFALLGSSLVLLLAWSEEWGRGPWPLLSAAFGNQWLLLGGWALYRYPDPRLSVRDRWFFAALGVWLTALPVASVLTSLPQWQSFTASAWWIPLHPDRHLTALVDDVDAIGQLVLALAYLGLWALRLRAASAAERRRRTPPALAATVATVVASLVSLTNILAVDAATLSTVDLVEAAAIFAVPVAFLVSILRRQLSRTRVTQLVHTIAGPPSTDGIRSALRTALEDPSLDLGFWDEETGSYAVRGSTWPPATGAPGRPAAGADRGADRVAAYVATTDGKPLAVVLADPDVVRDPELLSAATAVAGFSLEIARLLETVQRQLDDVRAASARAVHAADAERRRLEQDLHDGAQQHLLALGPLLGAAEASTRDADTAEQLADIRALLALGLRELREFARGVHPTSLALGLRLAVEQAAAGLPLLVTVDLPESALPPATAHAAYLLVTEALANVRRHARATHVSVTGELAGGVLALVIEDDGVGGAAAGAGTGITNMRDRVAALGGTFDLHSPPGVGTRLGVSLPCG